MECHCVWEEQAGTMTVSSKEKRKPEDIHAKQILRISTETITAAYLTTVMQGYTQTVLLVEDIMMALKSGVSTQWELDKSCHAQLNVWNNKCLLGTLVCAWLQINWKNGKENIERFDWTATLGKKNLVHLGFCLSNTWLSFNCLHYLHISYSFILQHWN